MTSELTPIRRRVVVRLDPAAAFALFTAEIGAWWPRELSVHGEGSAVAFDGDALVETSSAGERAVWGEVTDWQPGHAFSLSWHPGRPASPDATAVTVRFDAIEGGGSVVMVEHAGWERTPGPEDLRTEYDHGWPGVLAEFVGHAEAAAPTSWFLLRHTPGPNAPTSGSLQADPRFRDHLAFLQTLVAEGVLVAAGPMATPDRRTGMTIVRVPAAASDDYVRRAREEDASVAGGFLAVEVIPWTVVLSR